MEKYNYKHVIVVGVDGAGTFVRNTSMPRFSEIFDSASNGALTYNCLTSFPTISAQCWGSLLLGVKPSVHGLTNGIADERAYDKADYPSFFKLAREAMPDATLAAYCHWSPIYRGIIEPDLGVLTETGDDFDLTPKIVQCIKDKKPEVMFVQFDNIDGAGHGKGYGTPEYLEALTKEDALIGDIWDAIVEAGIADETLFIVTADHGGYIKGHGGLTDAEKWVFFAARGKTIAPIRDFSMHIRDIPSIVCYALGIEKHKNWDSFVPAGLFTDNTVSESRPAVEPSEFKGHKSVPTPIEGTDGWIGNFSNVDRHLAHFTFDGNENDLLGKVTAKRYGKIYYLEGYHGLCVGLSSEGYIELEGLKLGCNDFAISMWIRPTKFPSQKSKGEAVILTNKKMGTGDAGVAITLISSENGENPKVRFTVTNKSGRVCSAEAYLPDDSIGNWVHTAFCHYYKSGGCIIFINFDEAAISFNFPAEGEEYSVDNGGSFFIGQDATGEYPVSLEADLDDLIIKSAFSDTDASALRVYYK